MRAESKHEGVESDGGHLGGVVNDSDADNEKDSDADVDIQGEVADQAKESDRMSALAHEKASAEVKRPRVLRDPGESDSTRDR